VTPTFFAAVRIFDGVRFRDGAFDVLLQDGAIQAIDRSVSEPPGADVRRGGTLFPGFVDAHVHLSFSKAEAVAGGGVTTVLDLGAPEGFAFKQHPPLTFRSAGPLLTAPRGYPTRSWGANGYGLEITGATQAREAVARLAGRGAAIVKVAIEPSEGPVLSLDELQEITRAAHARDLRVAAHALDATSVRAALDAGIDVLAHTPVETLPEEVVKQAGSRGVAVISTLRAFGARASALSNLAALAAAGCSVAYGTDLGNGAIRPGLDAKEIGLLTDALGSREDALRSATSVAGSIAGRGGSLEKGSSDLMWIPEGDDPGDRKEVWKEGARLPPNKGALR
jgi:imidazolonepropionase-like amidohydrolase